VISDYDYGILTPRMIQRLTHLQACFPRTVVVDAKHLHRYRSLGATAVKPNYKQALALLDLPSHTEQRSPQIIAHRAQLLEITGAAIVAVTLDAEGAVVFDRHTLHSTAAIPAPNQQTSGAGDTYVSALTLALAAQASLALAASLAAAATAVVVQQAGTTCCTAEALIVQANP
jgi:D-beta-D-heptose 7-phosphate kinase/D-beta-D-heptose 1-phosphate adenosyltransferase